MLEIFGLLFFAKCLFKRKFKNKPRGWTVSRTEKDDLSNFKGLKCFGPDVTIRRLQNPNLVRFHLNRSAKECNCFLEEKISFYFDVYRLMKGAFMQYKHRCTMYTKRSSAFSTHKYFINQSCVDTKEF